MAMKAKKSYLLLPLLLLLPVAGCLHRPNDYSAFADIPDDGWPYGKTFLFLPQIEDSAACGSLAVAVRHTNAYPYANLILEVVAQQPDGNGGVAFRTDTLNITLADNSGHWLGRGLGTSFQLTDTLAARFTLLDGSPVRVRHIMRDDCLRHIEQVGIIFHASSTDETP